MCWKVTQSTFCDPCGRFLEQKRINEACDGANYDISRFGRCRMGVRSRKVQYEAECTLCRKELEEEQRFEEEQRSEAETVLKDDKCGKGKGKGKEMVDY